MIGRNLIPGWIWSILLSGFFLLGQQACQPCTDLDGDGFGNPSSILCPSSDLDCDDGDPAVNPAAALNAPLKEPPPATDVGAVPEPMLRLIWSAGAGPAARQIVRPTTSDVIALRMPI